MSRAFYTLAGWASFAVGLLGVFLPLLPTTVFMILAAFCFAKGSPRARKWLVQDTRFGAHILNWEAEGAIATSAKRLAVFVMIAVVVASVLLSAPWWVILVQVVAMIPVSIYIITRPVPLGETKT